MQFNKIIIVFILTGTAACAPPSIDQVDISKFFLDNESLRPYEIIIPSGAVESTIIWYGNNETRRMFVYPDSSILYVHMFSSWFPHSINTERILGEMHFLEWCAKFHVDLSGLQNDGLYWRDVKIGRTSIGYLNVSTHDVSQFDEAVAAFRPLWDYRVVGLGC